MKYDYSGFVAYSTTLNSDGDTHCLTIRGFSSLDESPPGHVAAPAPKPSHSVQRIYEYSQLSGASVKLIIVHSRDDENEEEGQMECGQDICSGRVILVALE